VRRKEIFSDGFPLTTGGEDERKREREGELSKKKSNEHENFQK
jgi:hypothetical protein